MEMSSYDPAATIGVTALGENDDLDNDTEQQRQRQRQRRRDGDGDGDGNNNYGNAAAAAVADDDDERREGGWLTRIVGSSSGSVSTSASSPRGVGSSSSSPDESLLLVSNLAESTTDGRRRRSDGAAAARTEGYEPPSLRAPPARDDDDDDERPEERVRDECSLFYVGADDDPGARSRTPAPLAERPSAASSASSASRRDHIHFQRQDTARASGSGPGRGGYRHRLTYYSPYLGGDARDAAAVSTADDEESVGRLRLADFSRSSLFYRNREGRVSMMLPSDSVRLLEDDQLEPGILLQVRDTQPPSYVLTVDALLYQRVVREIVARNSRCGLYFCFHENEEGGKVSIFIAVGILTVFFIACIALLYFRDFE